MADPKHDVAKVEITPEMIEAGRKAFSRLVMERYNDELDDDAIVAIFMAMDAARPHK